MVEHRRHAGIDGFHGTAQLRHIGLLWRQKGASDEVDIGKKLEERLVGGDGLEE